MFRADVADVVASTIRRSSPLSRSVRLGSVQVAPRGSGPTCVLAESLPREAVFDEIKARWAA